MSMPSLGATLCCSTPVSHYSGVSYGRTWALGTQASVVVAHGLRCSTAWEIFPDQGSDPCLLHRQVGSNHWTTREVQPSAFYAMTQSLTSSLLAQGLCTCCSSAWDMHLPRPSYLYVLAQGSAPQRDLPCLTIISSLASPSSLCIVLLYCVLTLPFYCCVCSLPCPSTRT